MAGLTCQPLLSVLAPVGAGAELASARALHAARKRPFEGAPAQRGSAPLLQTGLMTELHPSQLLENWDNGQSSREAGMTGPSMKKKGLRV